MLANDIVLDKKDGTDVTFRLVNSSAEGSRRIDIASTLALPATLVIKHSVTGKSPNVVDRHLVQLNKVVSTATGTATVVCNLTITVPRDVAVTPTVIHDMICHIIDLLTDGALITGLAVTANIDSLLRGES
jgi:hypothetical protein